MISLRTENLLSTGEFTVLTASQHDQISSSIPELEQGIFSYYLMRGMQGDADINNDGKLTLGEMPAYLSENVGRQVGMMSRMQEPQLIGVRAGYCGSIRAEEYTPFISQPLESWFANLPTTMRV